MTDTAESVRHDTGRLAYLLEVTGDPAGLRVLDLAARTGWFATALAERGATVHAIEGRHANAALIRPHPNLTVEVADVRTLSGETHGTFDVSLCLGILYHLDAPSVLGLLRSLAAVTTGYVVIDTNTCPWGPGPATGDRPAAAGPRTAVILEGQTWEGCVFGEGGGAHPWASLGGDAFWFTPPGLVRLIYWAGFRQVARLPGKSHPEEPAERLWYRAVP